METPETPTPAASPFKVGDKVEFEHVGHQKEGSVIEICEDGKIRMKDKDGYRYKYPVEKVRPFGTPPPPKEYQSQSNTNNQNQNQMSTKTKEAPKKVATPKQNGAGKKADAKKEGTAKPATQIDEETKKAILGLTSKRHTKLWLLHAQGLTNREVAEVAKGTNPGHVGNVVKQYNAKPELIEIAKKMLAEAKKG